MSKQSKGVSTSQNEVRQNRKDTAVIGIACRFPGASGYEKFWDNLENGINSIQEIPFERWDVEQFYSPDIDAPNKSISKWCGLLDEIDSFDHTFFKISPREATAMDPQQRMLLEETWHCIEDSGLSPEVLSTKTTSVHVGVMNEDYRHKVASLDRETDGYGCLGNIESILANRISHTFDFNGSSTSVNAACASSLVALHEARQQLSRHENDYALVCGVNLSLHPWKYISFSKARMLSPDGQCKTFDKDANGYVPGDGVGVLLLQRLEDAIAHGNHVYGVIRGSSVNHGGKALSLTAPEIEAQQDVIAAAYEDAAFSPESVNYVEAHGTGTSLGDPIEIAALSRAFGRHTDSTGFCKIGSVKTNIGHLEAAAGIAGVIKVLMMMKHRQIPPTLNIKTVNPIIEFEKTPFRIASGLSRWERVEKELPLRAGVSSFGFGGVNSHVLLEEYDGLPVQGHKDSDVPHFFALSAHSSECLKRMVQTWRSYTQNSTHEETSLPDMCRTLLAGRKPFPYRYGKWIKSKKELQDILQGGSSDSFEHYKGKNWCLRIDRQPWSGYEDVRQLVEKTAFYNQNVGRFYPEDRKTWQYLSRNFQKSVWPKRSTSLYSFIAEYAYVSSLFDLGLRPNLVIATQSGLWVALVVSGIADYDEVINILRGEKKIDQISLRRPVIPFYDPVGHKVIMPLHFTTQSVRVLVENVKIPKDMLTYYLEKARVLRTCQFTFKKFLEEWDECLRQAGYSTEIIDDDTLLRADTDEADRKRILTTIIITSSLRKLNRKWKLEDDSSLGDDRLNELLDLVTEGVMSQNILVELVLSGKTKYKEFAKTLNENQKLGDLRGTSWPLKRQKDHLSEIKDAPSWIAKIIACEEEPRLSGSDWNYFDFGEQPGSVSQDACYVRLKDGSYSSLVKAMSELWLKGVSVNWEMLYPEGTYQKCSLPCYPFERHSFWATSLPEDNTGESSQCVRADQKMEELSSSVRLTGHEFYFTDHIIKDQKILPGVVSLEFARAAVEAKVQKKVARISDVIWARPVIASSGGSIDSPIDLSISLQSGNDSMEYQVRKLGGKEPERTCAQGKIIFGNEGQTLSDQGVLDLDAVKKRLKYRKNGDECYHDLLVAGYQYGPCFQSLREISGNETEILAQLELPKACGQSSHDFFLHPTILDGALQSALMLLGVTTSNFYLPFSVDEVTIGGPLPERCYAHASLIDSTQVSDSLGRAFNIVIVDENGRILLSMKEVVMRLAPQKVSVKGKDASQGSRVQYYTNEWVPIVADPGSLPWLPDQGCVLLFDTSVRMRDTISGQLNKSGKKSFEVILVKPGKAFHLLASDAYEIDPGSPDDYQLLLENLAKDGRVPVAFIHHWSRSRFSANRESLSVQLQRCPYSLLYLCQALMDRKPTEQIRLIFLHHDQESNLQPQYLAVSGFARTIRLENPRLQLTSVIVRGAETDPLALDTMIATAALTELQQGAASVDEVLHVEGQRYKRHFSEIIPETETKPAMVYKKRGVYLISGGAGGVGLIIADHLAKTVQARLALIGRSDLTAEKKEIIRKIEAQGAEIIYINADISNQKDVESLVGKVKVKFGEINGIIHAAGVIRDSYAARKTPEEFTAVLAAKVFGTVGLDIATKDEPLDFFALFSSTTAVMGNAGQTDYAYANSFLDRYAEQRETLYRQKERSGKTVSINWPLWKDGGMKIDSRTEEFLDKTMGMKPLESQQGIRAFKLGIQLSVDQLTVVNGNPSKIRRFLNRTEASDQPNTEQSSSQTVEISNETLFSFVERELKSIAGKILGVAKGAMDTETTLGEYGFDSIGLTDYASRLNRRFHLELTPAIFFDQTTIGSLANYLVNDWRKEAERQFRQAHLDTQIDAPRGNSANGQGQNTPDRVDDDAIYAALLEELTTIAQKILAVTEGTLDSDTSWDDFGFDSISLTDYANRLNERFNLELTPALFFDCTTLESLSHNLVKQCGDQVTPKVAPSRTTSQSTEKLPKEAEKNPVQYAEHQMIKTESPDMTMGSYSREPVAIIGVSGIMPQSDDLDIFWEHLDAGRNLITEVPKDRWDWKAFYGDPTKETNKTDIKWGGFMKQVDSFDPTLFGISPREAEYMDPQHRIFLETVWKTFEDAGYAPAYFSGTKTGVFAGVALADYNELTHLGSVPIEAHASTGMLNSILANRISYLFNLRGPSEPIDTACSSSLVAIHRAVECIRSGQCEMAIAGGVNVILSLNVYIAFNKAGMLSKDGRCKTFDHRADGYVRGEGCGAVLLKPLGQAERDGDHVYGVIRGSAVNHGGHANSLTAPNPNAQAELLVEAYKNAEIDFNTVTYIEAHGTGTSLGDPIEINGLKKAFREMSREHGKALDGKATCGIGAVKTNVGHLEAAAGMAGLFKVLLSMKHGKLPGNLHYEKQNPYIQFEETPFYLVVKNQPWPRLRNQNRGTIPRRAGISSFGFGGVNAHVVLEEYPHEKNGRETENAHPHIVVLSAKNQERLIAYAQKVIAWLGKKEQQRQVPRLRDLAYTLQIGREEMEERLACVVTSLEELEDALAAYCRGEKDGNNLFYRSIKGIQGNEADTFWRDGKEWDEFLRVILLDKKYTKLAQLWVDGAKIDWQLLYSDATPRRVSLPTYPLARERYWVPVGEEDDQPNTEATQLAIHPLLQQNTSDLSEQRYSSIFTGKEFFLKDHVIKGQKILPGVAHLEMVRAGVRRAAALPEKGEAGVVLKNIVWIRPIKIDSQPLHVHLGLFPEQNDRIAFEIYSEPADADHEPVIYSQGQAVTGTPSSDVPLLDIKSLQTEFQNESLSSRQCYDAFEAMGFTYGPGHRGIEKVYMDKNRVLTKLALPSSVNGTLDQFVLHPGMMDSALQAALCFQIVPQNQKNNDGTQAAKPMLPFALQELKILGPCSASMWALVQRNADSAGKNNERSYDIDVCDDQGTICIRIKGFSVRTQGRERVETEGTLLLEPSWLEKAVPSEISQPDYKMRRVMLCGLDARLEKDIQARLTKADFLCLDSQREGVDKRFQAAFFKALQAIQSIAGNKPGGKLLVQVVTSVQSSTDLFSGLTGLLKTTRIEHPEIVCQFIEVDPQDEAAEVIEKLDANSRCPDDCRVLYRTGKRYVENWQELDGDKIDPALPWKDHGVYLITGGAGGLGLIFAREIVQKVRNANLIITGRSQPDRKILAQLQELESGATRIEYKQVDITQKDAVAILMHDIAENFSGLHGIVHCAGVVQDNYITEINREELEKVFAPKVTGLMNLDEASKDFNLDFFVLFSSVAGSLGNAGQACYSSANAFMDSYTVHRNNLVARKQRYGKTLSVNWPLWRDGGMPVDKETETMMMRGTGMKPMQSSDGILALYQAMTAGENQLMVVSGMLMRLRQNLCITETNTVPETNSTASVQLAADIPLDRVQDALTRIAAGILKVRVQDIDTGCELNEIGFDSILLTEFTNILSRKYELEFTPAIFFEYPTTLQSFAQYLVDEHQTALVAHFSVRQVASGSTGKAQVDDIIREKTSPALHRSRFAKAPSLIAREFESSTPEPIAIIGISGIFPMARDVDQFWANLVSGRDCIAEIPRSRWDWREYYGDPATEKNKTNIKWGGFIDGVDEFDPLFFGISPREAEFMDPQQRLLMTSVWKAIEDAGYSAESLSGSSMGIFAGTLNSGYNSLLSKANSAIEGYYSTGIVPSMGPSRMSYFLNIHGPSEPIETACSSSLVAIHRAVRAIEGGNCSVAVAGGVNVIITPELHLSFSKAGMLSMDGRCRTFSDQANGYVRGEGVGMIVLKKLKDAELAGDNIYGVIRCTAENHGGRANSLTAPNPKAQADLLHTAYSAAGIDPRTIGYIEAHGTGTELGDPIEINGLKTAFSGLYQAAGHNTINGSAHCGLGSVKTNIGHLELAAGIAGVIKVLLQLKHRTLVQSLHCKTVNPYIELDGSPFYIVKETGEWQSLRNEEGEELPRRAGVSSFGYGGVNAHVVLEEYIPREEKVSISPVNSVQPVVIVLSARTEDQLREQARQLHAAIKEHRIPDDDLTNMAFTLQVGRDAMNERLAMLVDTLQECEEKLRGFLEGLEDIENVYRGQVKQHKEIVSLFTADEELQEAVKKWVKRGKYAKVLNLWVNGLHVDWNVLHASGTSPHRISLPTYPFARQRYWVPCEDTQAPVVEPENIMATEAPVNPPESEFMWLPRWTEDSKQPVTSRKNGLDNIIIMCSGQTSELAKTIDKYHRKNTSTENIIFVQLGDQTKRVSRQEWICGVDDSAGLQTCLGQLESVDRIYFISAGHGVGQKADLKILSQSPQYNEIQLLRLVRFLKKQNAVSHRADCYVITQNTCSIAGEETNPYGSGISGLAYSIAQGEHQFAVRNIDISEEDLSIPTKREALTTLLLNEGGTDRGEQVAFRAGRRYVRSFFLLDDSGLPQETGLKEEGVYVILGGSGSIGVAITRYLMQEYNAKVVWIGRKPEPAKSIQEKIGSMRECGETPLYIQADTTSISDMKKALATIKKHHPIINGAIFSGVVFKVQNSIAKTTEKEFIEILDVKNKGIINFHEVFQDESLDFLCLFSSAQAFSFSGAAHFSAYASGITFSDVFSGFLARTSRFPIGIVNWGFWKSALKAASPDTTKISREAGFLEDKEGIGCFERFIRLLMGGFLNQSICMNATGPVRELMRRNTKEVLRVNEKSSAPMIPALLVDKIDKNEAPDLLRGKDNSQEFINQWMVRLLFEQIRRLGILQQNGIWETRQALRKKAEILEKYDRWLKECLSTLEYGEYICSKDGAFAVTDSNCHENNETVWQEWELVQEYRLGNSDFRARINLMDACLRTLPEILRGNIPATDILFPNSSMELVEGVYKGNVLSDFFNSLVADAVGEYVQQRVKEDPRAKVRIIEIGAGTGSTSAMVFDRLKPHADHVEYCYTDISKSFLLYAEEQYGPSNPFLLYKLWNIEKPLTDQEVALGSYDLAIATNVMHATKNIRQAIRNAKASLKANGILLLNEMTRKSVFTTLTFGLLDGWWLFEDEHLRISGAPLLDPSAWNEVLKEEGFRAVHFPVESLSDSEQQVIAAESDGIIRLPAEKKIPTVSDNELAGAHVKSIDQVSINHDSSLRISRQDLQKARPVEFASEDNLEQYVEEMVSDILSKTLKVPTESIDNTAAFSDYGIDSIVGIAFVKQLNDMFSTDLNSAILFDYTSVHSISTYLVTQYGKEISKWASVQDTNRYEYQNEQSMITDIQSVPEGMPIISENLFNDSVLFKHFEDQFLDDKISAGSLIELILDNRK